METDIYLSNAQKIIIESGKNSVTIDGKTYRLVEEKPERPEQNPKIYTPKEVMEHLLRGGWVEYRDRCYLTSKGSYYLWLNTDGYFSRFFKRDDASSVSESNSPYKYDIRLGVEELKAGKYFLIDPIAPEKLSRKGRQGVDA